MICRMEARSGAREAMANERRPATTAFRLGKKALRLPSKKWHRANGELRT